MPGLFQDHCLEDDELLRVPLSVPHPSQISHQFLQEASPSLPACRIIAPQWHDREVTPPPLPLCVVPDSAIKVCARDDMNPFSVDLPETKVLRGWGVPRLVPLLPFPLRWCRHWAALLSPRFSAGRHLLCWSLFPATLSFLLLHGEVPGALRTVSI